eukprot:TRINITY_DN314_c0_g2_i1.p1 TRINITY_DN314_c0_g2~~TRINITY_DN314_c0_g2_i1.p1  ORF type:complete len:713 (+),score=248.90 TRINITY_DN314_c0_g2_i1:86-2140(+)
MPPPGAPGAANAAERLEVRLYRTDAGFRRFHEAFQVDVPRLHWSQLMVTGPDGRPMPAPPPPGGAQQPQMRLVFTIGGQKVVHNPDGSPSPDTAPLLKASLASYMRCKEAWRKTGLPSFFVGLLSRAGLAPSLAMQPAEAAFAGGGTAAEEAVRARRSARWSLGVALFLMLLAAAVIFYWPVWDVLIDPDAGEHYAVLGVRPGATRKEIKSAFRKKAMQWHPDKNPGCGKRCQVMFLKIQEAHTLLTTEKQQHALELSQKSKENNGQILAFVGMFMGRVLDVVYQATEFIVGATSLDTSARARTALRAALHVGCMLLFLFEDGIQIGSVVFLLFGGMKLKNILQEGGQVVYRPDYNHARWEIDKYVRWFLVPPTVLYAASEVHSLNFATQPWTTVLRGTCGVIYVMSFIMRHKPYIFVNHGLQASCTNNWHPNWGMWKPNPFSLWGFWKYLVWDVGLDDLLAFAMHIPWMHRVSCLTIILCAMLQRAIYPSLTLKLEKRSGAQVQEPLVPWGSPEGWQRTWMEMNGQMGEQQERDQQELRGQSRERNKLEKRAERERREELAQAAAKDGPPLSEKERAETEKREKKERKERLQREKDEYVASTHQRRLRILVLVLGGIAVFLGGIYFLDQHLGGGVDGVNTPGGGGPQPGAQQQQQREQQPGGRSEKGGSKAKRRGGGSRSAGG